MHTGQDVKVKILRQLSEPEEGVLKALKATIPWLFAVDDEQAAEEVEICVYNSSPSASFSCPAMFTGG